MTSHTQDPVFAALREMQTSFASGERQIGAQRDRLNALQAQLCVSLRGGPASLAANP